MLDLIIRDYSPDKYLWLHYNVKTYVHMSSVARSSHEDPVRMGGLGRVRKKVGSLIVLSQDVTCLRIAITPVQENNRGDHQGTWVVKGHGHTHVYTLAVHTVTTFLHSSKEWRSYTSELRRLGWTERRKKLGSIQIQSEGWEFVIRRIVASFSLWSFSRLLIGLASVYQNLLPHRNSGLNELMYNRPQ